MKINDAWKTYFAKFAGFRRFANPPQTTHLARTGSTSPHFPELPALVRVGQACYSNSNEVFAFVGSTRSTEEEDNE
jgi:hypothetical protein